MSTDAVIGRAELKEIGRAQRLKPVENDFKGRKGYWRKYRSDGSGKYDWGYKFRPNNGNGKLTREAEMVGEMMRPFQRADVERHSKLQAKLPRVAMKDRDGGVRYLDPALADAAARRNGWSHRAHVGGCRVERGISGGMLWSLSHGEWRPLGVRCLGAPLHGRREVPCRGTQQDPDGGFWRAHKGRWVRV